MVLLIILTITTVTKLLYSYSHQFYQKEPGGPFLCMILLYSYSHHVIEFIQVISKLWYEKIESRDS